MSGLTRDGIGKPNSRDEEKKKTTFPIQLTTSSIGNHTMPDYGMMTYYNHFKFLGII